MRFLIGKTIGRYHILEQIGEGGMAIVYKALDTRLEREVAVKIILPGKEYSEKFIKRFEREAKALAALSHPNIVGVIDYGEEDGFPYLVMEYLPAGNLKRKLASKPLVWNEAVRILQPIARALAYAHQNNIIHRDVKSSNILITDSGEPMLADFGVAKIIQTEETMDLTGAGVGVGTPEYMAPEQAQGKGVDARSDIYSLGVVLYEMVTGRKPFQAETPMAVIFKLASEPLPRPTQFSPDLPQAVEMLLLKALDKNPENRYQNMSEFALVMEKLLRSSGEKTKPKNNFQWLPWLVGIGLIAIIGVGMVLSLPKGNDVSAATSTQEQQIALLSTATQTLPATSTPIPEIIPPTPVPTEIPLEYVEGKILFEDDFEDGNYAGWAIDEETYWEVVQDEDGNQVFKVTTPDRKMPVWAYAGQSTWLDYRVRTRVKIAKMSGEDTYGLDLNLRVRQPRYHYQITFSGFPEYDDVRGGIHRFSGGEWQDDLINFEVKMDPGQWYEIEMLVYQDIVRVLVDGKLLGEYVDANAFGGGQFVLAPEEGHFGQITYFDDVQVLELLPNTMDTDDASLPTLSITVDGTAEDWLGLSPVLLDENDDSLLPNELELLGVYASRDDEFIYVLFEGVDAFSKSIERSAALRFLSPSDESCEPFLHEIAINVAGQVFSHNDPIPLDFASSKSVFLDVLEFRIPFSSVFYEECQFFEISTAWINSPELGSWEVMDSVP